MERMEENVVSSTTSVNTSSPVTKILTREENNNTERNSVDFIAEFLNESSNSTGPNMVHATGADFVDNFGMSLTKKLGKIPKRQAKRVLLEMAEIQMMRSKYLDNIRIRKNYEETLELRKKALEKLQMDVESLRTEVQGKREQYMATEKNLKHTEAELSEFQVELKRKLRFNEEMRRLRNEKESIEREIRLKSRLTLKCQQKLYNKAIKEKELKKDLSDSIEFAQEVKEIVEKNDFASAEMSEELENIIVEGKMQLALYEDSDMEEIKALHDGQMIKDEKDRVKKEDKSNMEEIDISDNEV